MAVETLMFKLEGIKQATQASALVGKTFTVGKVSSISTGINGLGKWLFLVPSGKTAGSTVALKIEGGRQAAQLAGLAGKTVTVGQSPTVIGATSKWLVLNSGKGAVVAAGAGSVAAKGGAAAAAKGKIGSNMVLMQLEGTRQAAQMKVLSGKTFTVIKSPVVGGAAKGWLFMKPAAGAVGKDVVALSIQNGTAGNLSGMVGKSFTLLKAPMAAGNTTGSWVIFQPAGGAIAKGVAGGAAAVAAKGKGVAAATGKVAATGTGVAATGTGVAGLEELKLGGAAAGETAGKAKVAALKGGNTTVAAVKGGNTTVAAVKGGGSSVAAAKPAASKVVAGSNAAAGSGASAKAVAAKTGTIWSGSGLSLGLGWGLGAWGPVMLASLVAAVGYGAYQYYRNRQEFEEEGDLVEAS